MLRDRYHPRRGAILSAAAGASQIALPRPVLLLLETLLTEVQDLMFIDVRVVLRQRRRKGMRPIVLADEVEVVHGGRRERGLQRGAARRSDRARRKARVLIGVVGRIDFQVLLPDVAIV